MRRDKAKWAAFALLAGPAGIAVAKLHLIAPTPGVFFILGAMATLCLGGIAYGVWDGPRKARAGTPIKN